MDNKRYIKLFKYSIMLIILILALVYVPPGLSGTTLSMTEITIISIIGVITFTLLDMYCPYVIVK